MGHKEIKSELITVETIQGMGFSSTSFKVLRDLSIMQIQQISTISQNLESYQESNRLLKNEILKTESAVGYLDKIIKLRDKKVIILKKKVKYLKFRRSIEITVNNVKNAE
jgi:hypothetical protein